MPKKTTWELSKIISDYLEQNGVNGRRMTAQEFGDKTGFSRSYIQMLATYWEGKGQFVEPTVETLQKLARGMEMNLHELMIKCGYLEEESSPIHPVETIADKFSPEVQKIIKEWGNGEEIDKYIIFADTVRREELDDETISHIEAIIKSIAAKRT